MSGTAQLVGWRSPIASTAEASFGEDDDSIPMEIIDVQPSDEASEEVAADVDDPGGVKSLPPNPEDDDDDDEGLLHPVDLPSM